jgi:hypothetical protein
MMIRTLEIDFRDIVRATLDDHCGNEGYIGISPDGRQYHIVVPVDRQMARGLKAGNKPSDETPFGGFKGWVYFCCPTYSRPVRYNEAEIHRARQEQAGANISAIKNWARLSLGVEIKASLED